MSLNGSAWLTYFGRDVLAAAVRRVGRRDFVGRCAMFAELLKSLRSPGVPGWRPRLSAAARNSAAGVLRHSFGISNGKDAIIALPDGNRRFVCLKG